MIDSKVRGKFPDLEVRLKSVGGITIERESDALEKLKSQVAREVKETYDLETLKDDPDFRKYRDFFWKIDIDPTKIRPASEALIRRILQGKTLPTINTGVDAYNLASIKSSVPLAAFDKGKLKGELSMMFANGGEEFFGIGMKRLKILAGNEIIIKDEEKLIAIYPYRDADDSKVTFDTKEILLMSCGVPGVTSEKLEEAVNLAGEYLARYCKG
ncbi:MAG: phenylalanine--tRNA ligase beta subunit-related protein [Candidatus Hydrothermarchaeaceae archaeon]